MIGHPYQARRNDTVNLTFCWRNYGNPMESAPALAHMPVTNALLWDHALSRRIMDATPMGWLATPAKVAAAILFLASDAAAMITGHTQQVDSGWLAQ